MPRSVWHVALLLSVASLLACSSDTEVDDDAASSLGSGGAGGGLGSGGTGGGPGLGVWSGASTDRSKLLCDGGAGPGAEPGEMVHLLLSERAFECSNICIDIFYAQHDDCSAWQLIFWVPMQPGTYSLASESAWYEYGTDPANAAACKLEPLTEGTVEITRLDETTVEGTLSGFTVVDANGPFAAPRCDP